MPVFYFVSLSVVEGSDRSLDSAFSLAREDTDD